MGIVAVIFFLKLVQTQNMRQNQSLQGWVHLLKPAVLTPTSRNHSGVGVSERPHVMRMVFKGPGSEPLLVLPVHSGGHELELDDGAFRRPGDHAALVLFHIHKHD